MNCSEKVEQNNVIWQGWDGFDEEIYLYNISTMTTSQITDNNYFDYNPQAHSGKVVWTAWDDADGEIFMYDTATRITTKITNDIYEDDFPYIQDGQIVWHKHITDDPLNQEIFVYDIATGVTTQISNNSYEDYDPVVFNGNIVWYGFDGSDYEILLAKPAEAYTISGLSELANLTVIQDQGVKNSLVSKAENALRAYNNGDIIAAKNILNAFINQIEAQRAKKIDVQTTDMLINYAREVINRL